MTLQRTDEVLTFTKEHYIDKTQELKKGIETFPSIFIEGAAESGKTVAVNMLMKEQKDTDFVLFLMDREKDDGSFIRKLSLIRRRMEKEKIWVVCENMNQPLSDAKAEALVEFVKRLADGNRCMYISDKLTILHGQSDHLSRRFRSLISERDSRRSKSFL